MLRLLLLVPGFLLFSPSSGFNYNESSLHSPTEVATCAVKGNLCVLNKVNSSDFLVAGTTDKCVIKDVWFECSNFSLLGPSVCRSFRDLRGFWARESAIEFVDFRAFENCTKLQALSLEGNSISKLHSKTFHFNSALEHLLLSKNQLTEIEENLFDGLKNLRRVNLDNNKLKIVDPEAFKDLQRLEYLEIFSNQILALDSRDLAKKLPNLREIWLGDNDFACEDVPTILAPFKVRSIKVGTTVSEHKKWQKSYGFGGLDCLPMEVWEEKKSLVKFDDAIYYLETTERIIFEFESGAEKVLKGQSIVISFVSILINCF